MKEKIYTSNIERSTLEEVGHFDEQFTAEELAYIVKKDFREDYASKAALMRFWLSNNPRQLEALSFLIEHLYKNGYMNIVSFGSGTCVFEYLLKSSLPEKAKVIATDFNPYTIERTAEIFPELDVETFDLLKDDMSVLKRKLNMRFDLALFGGSAHVMDDADFIKQLNDLAKENIKEVVDLHAAFIDNRTALMVYLRSKRDHIKKDLPWLYDVIAAILRLKNEIKPKKFHGYYRTKNELRKIYKKSGYNIKKEMSLGAYEYVAVLEPAQIKGLSNK